MKLAPASIPYRTLQRSTTIIVIAVFIVAAGGGQSLGGALVVGILTAAAIAFVFTYELAYFERFEYEFTDDTFDIRSGVISRREREIPYRRIQNVDISRNVIQRLIGIAAVSLETAGGSQTEGSIRYVTYQAAEHLQHELQRRKHRIEGEPTAEPKPPAERSLYEITPFELGLVGALSFDARIFGLVAILASGSIPILTPLVPDPALLISVVGLGLLILLTLTSWLLGLVLAVLNYYGFRLTQSDDDLRYERGLLRRYSGSIPLTKVQTITIEDNPLKRAFGYATLTVETAGYGPGRGGGQESQAAVPIALRDRVASLAEDIEGVEATDIRFERPPKRVRYRYAIRYGIVVAVLVAIGFAANTLTTTPLPWYGLAVLAVLIPPAAHYKWKHRGYWEAPNHIVTRNGFWVRSVKIVPYYRIQTVIEFQTILQRRWDIATVLIDTASSQSLIGAGAAAVDIDDRDAAGLRESLNDALQQAIVRRRQPARGFAWLGDLAGPGLTGLPGPDPGTGDDTPGNHPD